MREIVLDTETTGLDPAQGHRLVELGCIELLNGIPTGATFHAYVNPERDVPAEAFAVWEGQSWSPITVPTVAAAIALVARSLERSMMPSLLLTMLNAHPEAIPPSG